MTKAKESEHVTVPVPTLINTAHDIGSVDEWAGWVRDDRGWFAWYNSWLRLIVLAIAAACPALMLWLVDLPAVAEPFVSLIALPLASCQWLGPGDMKNGCAELTSP